jgi:signal transduction histidine kinase
LQILGQKKGQIVGKGFFDALPFLTIEDKPINERKHPVFLALGPKPYTQVTPFFCKSPNEKKDAMLAMNVLQIRKGRSVVGAVIQIRKAERELNIGEMKSLFVSFAAHQLKTPSSIVKGFLELLMREGQRSYTGDQWNFLISAFESNEHLIHVSKTLLSLARLEGGLIAPQVRQFDPRQLIQNKIRSMDALLKIKKIEVTFLSQGKGFIKTDDNFFLEIFEIILANAVKHSSSGTKISVMCNTSKQGTEVHVIDNGPGISDAMKDKLFLAAQDVSPDKNTHGLGLYMAKKYVALLGGTIGVKDAENQKGSDFYFLIPNS